MGPPLLNDQFLQRIFTNDFTEKTAKDAKIAKIYQRKILQIRVIRGFFQ